jgi:hypothetical protein
MPSRLYFCLLVSACFAGRGSLHGRRVWISSDIAPQLAPFTVLGGEFDERRRIDASISEQAVIA